MCREHKHEETKNVVNRLSRAIGHLESVKRMVEEDRDCADVLIQLAAVRAAIEEADTASFLHPNAGTLDFMRSLKERGFKIGILTNMPRELAPRFRERFAGTVALTDALVVSCEVRLVKPMREIYDLMAQTLAVPGGEICFFDDAPVNCRGARDAGWHSICFTSISEAASEFEKLAESVCARQRRDVPGNFALERKCEM